MTDISKDVINSCNLLLSYLSIKDLPKHADAIFISGGKSLSTLNKAKDLFNQGFSSNIVFVGKSVGAKASI